MKRWIAALLFLSLLFSFAAAEESFVFGQTELGRDMNCVRIGAADAPKSILLTFATHMFEDAADFDGEYLISIAEVLMAHYRTQEQTLGDWALYFVPCVNPDAREEGFSNLDFGRLNAKGLDINRDFPEKWRYQSTKSSRTGDAPFATAEARAIRDLVEQIHPTYAVDVHGWINGVYGYYPLARVFHQAFRIEVRDYSSGGMLAQWMNTVTQGAILLELPPKPAAEGYVDNIAGKMIEALDKWMLIEPEQS